ncbi:glycosyltransferase [Tepidiphilus baoligensis]|uniref:glycosyltransferase n=1 Tax=Tepidiphilus baoligensis TaxID=2698687 RepID=UPI0019D58B50|nr:glycosyltransferase [Tepidiphilus baoligensis]
MKVSQVMLSKGFGGAERYFVDLCTALARRGHAVQAICHRGSEAERRLRGIPNLELAPIRVLGTWDPLASWAIHRALRRFAPQIVHVHLRAQQSSLVARPMPLANRSSQNCTITST